MQFFNLFFFHEAEGKSYRRNLLIPDFGNNWEDFAIAFIIGHPEATVTGWSKLPVNSGMFRFGTALAKNSLKFRKVSLSPKHENENPKHTLVLNH